MISNIINSICSVEISNFETPNPTKSIINNALSLVINSVVYTLCAFFILKAILDKDYSLILAIAIVLLISNFNKIIKVYDHWVDKIMK